MHLHVVGPAVAAHPGGVVEGRGGGDEVVALPRVELQRVRHRRERPEPDCEHAATVTLSVAFVEVLCHRYKVKTSCPKINFCGRIF